MLGGRGRNAHGLLRLTRPAPRVSPRGHRTRPSADNLLIGDRASSRVRGPLRCVMDGLALGPHHRAAQLAARGLHSWLGQQRAGLKRVRPSGAACGGVSERPSHKGRQDGPPAAPLGARQVLAPRGHLGRAAGEGRG